MSYFVINEMNDKQFYFPVLVNLLPHHLFIKLPPFIQEGLFLAFLINLT
jgi:hypothetical protein